MSTSLIVRDDRRALKRKTMSEIAHLTSLFYGEFNNNLHTIELQLAYRAREREREGGGRRDSEEEHRSDSPRVFLFEQVGMGSIKLHS